MKHKLSTWQLVLFIGVLLVAGILALVDRSAPVVPTDPLTLSRYTCEASGGAWDACGSPCAEGEELCIQVCVEMCVCKTDSDCPFSYTCREGVNKQSLCQKSVSE